MALESRSQDVNPMSVLATSQLVLQAPAKLNLFLKVVGKRADGYHEIDTLMQSVSLYDTLRLQSRLRPEITLEIVQTLPPKSGEIVRDVIPTGEENLVVRAARLLQQASGCVQGAHIQLWKRIPSQAGLGGGSADAGAVLRGLNQLWQTGLHKQELAMLGAELGSDIPFFAAGESLAICGGRGESLVSAQGPRLHFVIAKPHSGLSTAQVYSGCVVSAFSQSGKDMVTALHAGGVSRLKLLMRNGLEESARRLNPAVDELLGTMSALPFVCSLLSGSGSACFGICHGARQARHLAGRLKGMISGEVFVAHSLR